MWIRISISLLLLPLKQHVSLIFSQKFFVSVPQLRDCEYFPILRAHLYYDVTVTSYEDGGTFWHQQKEGNPQLYIDSKHTDKGSFKQKIQGGSCHNSSFRGCVTDNVFKRRGSNQDKQTYALCIIMTKNKNKKQKH